MAHASIRTRHLAVTMLAGLLLACSSGGGGSGSDSGTNDVVVSWNANPESTVNSKGGGYRVFYSQDQNFQPGDNGVMTKDVTFSDGNGQQTPTQTTISGLSDGQWFFRVRAFSDLNPPASTEVPDPAKSELSDQMSITVGN